MARAAFSETGSPVLVTAKRQESGRGRTGSGWLQAPRAVATSIAMDMPWEGEDTGPLPLVAGLAMREALAAFGSSVSLKWPNDLLDAAGDKVGGILSEASGGSVVIGVGVNLYFPDAPKGIGAVFDADPGPDVSDAIAVRWADKLLDHVARGPGWDRDAYRLASTLLGEAITWEGGSGTAVDIAEDGALIVVSGTERLELRSGAVRLVRRATLAADDDAPTGEQT